MNINGKKALVLGGTSGIGLAAASALKARGASVTVFGRSAGNLENARTALGAGAECAALDVLDRGAMAAAFAKLRG